MWHSISAGLWMWTLLLSPLAPSHPPKNTKAVKNNIKQVLKNNQNKEASEDSWLFNFSFIVSVFASYGILQFDPWTCKFCMLSYSWQRKGASFAEATWRGEWGIKYAEHGRQGQRRQIELEAAEYVALEQNNSILNIKRSERALYCTRTHSHRQYFTEVPVGDGINIPVIEEYLIWIM